MLEGSQLAYIFPVVLLNFCRSHVNTKSPTTYKHAALQSKNYLL